MCVLEFVHGLCNDINRLDVMRKELGHKANIFKQTEEVISRGLVLLSKFLKENLTIERECILTAFSLTPTKEMLNQVTARDLDVLQDGQRPFAVIVGCADSRTPPTILFNQGLGRLFIVRVAGNTVDRRGLASIVYAVKYLKCPVVIVLGHTGCGAVAAAQAVVEGRSELDPSIEEMVTPIIPAVLEARAGGAADLAVASVEENARRVARRLESSETALADAIGAGRLKIVAAVKDVKTGEVRFLG